MSSRPVVVVVQGAYQTAEFYHEFEEEIRKRGFEVFHPILPTASNPDDPLFPTRTISDDAEAVAAQIRDLVAQGRDIVVVVHSYGGLVASEAIEEAMSCKTRKASGSKGGVSSMIWLSAFALQEGTSVLSAFGRTEGEDEFHPDGRNTFIDAETRLFNDFDAAQKAKWMAKVIPHSTKTHEYVMTNSAWKFIPTTYIILDQDRCTDLQEQQMICKMIGAREEHFDAGHEAMISRSTDLGEKIVTLIS